MKTNTNSINEKAKRATTVIPRVNTNTSEDSSFLICCIKRSYFDMKRVLIDNPSEIYPKIQFILRYLNPIKVFISTKAICRVAGLINAKFSSATTS